MITAFNSVSIWDSDKIVRDYFREMLIANGIFPRTVGIDIQSPSYEMTPEIAKDEIQQSQCIVAVLTRRYVVDGWKSSEWLIEESAMGYYGNKPVYVFYEQGVEIGGMLKNTARWCVEFNRYTLNYPEEYIRLNSWVDSIREEAEPSGNPWQPGGLIINILAAIGAVTILAGGLYLIGKALE